VSQLRRPYLAIEKITITVSTPCATPSAMIPQRNALSFSIPHDVAGSDQLTSAVCAKTTGKARETRGATNLCGRPLIEPIRI